MRELTFEKRLCKNFLWIERAPRRRGSRACSGRATRTLRATLRNDHALPAVTQARVRLVNSLSPARALPAVVGPFTGVSACQPAHCPQCLATLPTPLSLSLSLSRSLSPLSLLSLSPLSLLSLSRSLNLTLNPPSTTPLTAVAPFGGPV